jgi:hypothetical protein
LKSGPVHTPTPREGGRSTLAPPLLSDFRPDPRNGTPICLLGALIPGGGYLAPGALWIGSRCPGKGGLRLI